MSKDYPARGKQKLTAAQEELLAFVTTADNRWREAKLNAQIELRRLVQERIDLHAATRDRAVYDAIKGGVPKARITQDGLRTGPNVVYDIMERVTEKLGLTNVELALKPVHPYTWSDRIDLPNGFKFWFLIVDGDDHVTTEQGPIPEHAGYPYVRELTGSWTWVLGKPSAEAQAWAEENKPE